MAWSTRELARLAGTTVNTIRHYHRLGLLEVPEREENGYKQYEARHLVRLLRIRRLVSLGVPLSQVEELTASDDTTPEMLRAIDAELAESIERFEKARADIAAILREKAPPDIPAGFEPVASRLSDADRSIIHVYTRLYDESALADVREMVDADTDALGDALNALADDADDDTRQRVAGQLAPVIAQYLTDYPWLRDPASHATSSARVTEQTFITAMTELYNSAQRDVLARASMLAHGLLREAEDAAEDGP